MIRKQSPKQEDIARKRPRRDPELTELTERVAEGITEYIEDDYNPKHKAAMRGDLVELADLYKSADASYTDLIEYLGAGRGVVLKFELAEVLEELGFRVADFAAFVVLNFEGLGALQALKTLARYPCSEEKMTIAVVFLLGKLSSYCKLRLFQVLADDSALVNRDLIATYILRSLDDDQEVDKTTYTICALERWKECSYKLAAEFSVEDGFLSICYYAFTKSPDAVNHTILDRFFKKNDSWPHEFIENLLEMTEWHDFFRNHTAVCHVLGCLMCDQERPLFNRVLQTISPKIDLKGFGIVMRYANYYVDQQLETYLNDLAKYIIDDPSVVLTERITSVMRGQVDTIFKVELFRAVLDWMFKAFPLSMAEMKHQLREANGSIIMLHKGVVRALASGTRDEKFYALILGGLVEILRVCPHSCFTVLESVKDEGKMCGKVVLKFLLQYPQQEENAVLLLRCFSLERDMVQEILSVARSNGCSSVLEELKDTQ